MAKKDQFCAGCTEDIQWLIAEELRRIVDHPEYEPGCAPYHVDLTLMDEGDNVMSQFDVHLNTIHCEVHQIGWSSEVRTVTGEERITRRNSYLCARNCWNRTCPTI